MSDSAATAPKHLEFLDELRGVAIISVFAFHALSTAFSINVPPWGGLARNFGAVTRTFILVAPAIWGWAGVPLFFVISGYCIHLSFVRGCRSDWRRFALRRFFRIYPPYVMVLLVLAILGPLTRVDLTSRRGLAQLGSHLLLVHDLDDRSSYGINAAFWSVAVEAQLYALYPVLLYLVRRAGWYRSLLGVGLLEIGIDALNARQLLISGHELPRSIIGLPFAFWFSWAIGAAIADASAKRNELPFSGQSWKLWMLTGMAAYLFKPSSPFCFLLFALASAAAIAARLRQGTATTRWHRPRAHLRRLGLCSYSFYLIHLPILDLVSWAISRTAPHTHPLAAFALCLCSYPPVLALSEAMFKHVEKPSMAAGKRLEDSLHPARLQVSPGT